ncbi:MAG: hypothetical protein OXN17_04035 [Candidatus Poribacteria bacterium]|nr:hypothetical protein [Candidatus Poribacteria bacterium]MDE0503025.1 hypothetical protein [Candidatus Poribacteria bacterium]
MRLVRDNSETFHFQWDKALNEECIVLVRYSGVKVIHNDYSRHFPPNRPFTQRKHHREYSMEFDGLYYFPAGSFVSAALTDGIFDYRYGLDHTCSVEILPAHLRNTLDFPAELYVINDAGDFERYSDQVILRDHPHRDYRVDGPSRLTFWEDWQAEMERWNERNAD